MKNTFKFILQWLGIKPPFSQTTISERECLARHAKSKMSLMEIGVFQGVTTCVLRAAMHPQGLLIGVDPFFKNRLGICFYKLIALREIAKVANGKVKFLEMTSAHVSKEEWDGKENGLDFLFVDGDHSWDGIEGDWHGFKHLIVPGGIVALHDSRNCGACGSERYIQEVILKDAQFELIETVDSLTVIRRV